MFTRFFFLVGALTHSHIGEVVPVLKLGQSEIGFGGICVL